MALTGRIAHAAWNLVCYQVRGESPKYASFILGSSFLASARPASAATATVTTLAVTSSGSPVTTVAPKSLVTLSATVTAAGTGLTTGQVNFCDGSSTYCTDIHLLGTAQLTSAGTATLKLIPGIGSHSYKAVFVGTSTYATSSSALSALAVTHAGAYASASTLTSTGSTASYTLTSSVVGAPLSTSLAPTGVISFLDTTSNNRVLGTASLVPNPQSLSFNSPNAGFSVDEPSSMVTGDFNGDGKPDLVVVGNDGGSAPFVVALGNGDGTFTSSILTAISGVTTIEAVGDFNQDGNLDMVALGTDGLTTLLGNGDGTFNSVVDSASIADSGSWVAGDFNGDGKLDLVASGTTGGDSVLYFMGNGDGTFAAPTTAASAPSETKIAAGDFNGDGRLDLALIDATGGTVSVLLGQGDGSFAAPSPTAIAGLGYPLAMGDFNGDGKLDLVVVNDTTSIVTILLGNGDGTFKASSTIPVCCGVEAFSVADFNADGKADLAMLVDDSNNNFDITTASIFLGQGDGTFLASASPSAPTRGGLLVTADFNGDGFSDIASASDYGGGPNILLAQLFPATATVSNIAVPGTGTHQVTASYPGDGTYASSVSSPVALTATPSAAITFSVSNHIYGDAPFTVSATSNSTGAFTYSVVSGPAAITGSTVTLTGAGAVVLQASQAAADGYSIAAQKASLTVSPATLTITANNLARVYGAANPTLTGTLTGAVNGDVLTETFSTTATPASIVGSYPIVPSATGAHIADYTVNSNSATLTVSQAGTATTLALSNGNASLTATVAALTSGMPTGTVAFYEGQTKIGTAALSNGKASYTATSLTGDMLVSAQYSGDADFTQSASPATLVLSAVPAKTALSVASSGSVADTVELSPAPGYSGTVQFSCTGLPQAATCSFQPSSVAFTGSNKPTSISVTIQTGVSTQAALRNSNSQNDEGLGSFLAAVIWVPGFLPSLFGKRRRKARLPTGTLLLLSLLLCGMSATLSACGGSSSTTTPPSSTSTPAGTYAVEVVSAGTGGLSQTTTLNLTVQTTTLNLTVQ